MLGAGFQLTQLQRAQSDVSYGRSILAKEQKLLVSAASSSSNVERFLESVTPSVPAHYLSKTTVRERRGSDIDLQGPYFVLEDVWESFAEWSAYGIGVPLTLNNNNNNERVFQYYVPSLSAIQLYADSDALSSSLQARRLGEKSESDFRDSSSEGGSSESERELCYPKEQISAGMDRISLRKELQLDSSSDDGEPLTSQGRLVFEYLERDLPYIREPFADKVSDLASRFPELKTLRSCDLLASSWFSVAWYPIYRIPTGPTLKDLDACFLTYHLLHTPFQGPGVTTESVRVVQPSECEGVEKMALPVFGLASYKLRGSVWTSIKGSGHHLPNSLFQAADNWLRLHQVNHPDFIFFCCR